MKYITREQFYQAVDDYLCQHPELDGLDLIRASYDETETGWYALGRLNKKSYLISIDEKCVSVEKL